MRTFLFSLVVLAVLSGCTTTPAAKQSAEGITELPALSGRAQLFRPESGLVCVAFDGYEAGGISCVKESR